MRNAMKGSVEASRLSCTFFETGKKLQDRIDGHHYVEIFLYNINLVMSAVQTINHNNPSHTTPGKFKQLLCEVGILTGAIALGRYCEEGDASRIQNRIVRKICIKLHYASYLISGLALGILAFRSKWFELTVAVVTFAAKHFACNGSLPISQNTLNIGINICQFTVGCFVNPLSFSTLESASFLSGIATRALMSKRKAQYIWRTNHFHSRKLPEHPTFEDPIWSSKNRSKSIEFDRRAFEIDRGHLVSYRPLLEDANFEIGELQTLFDSVDWSDHQNTIADKLKSDRKWVHYSNAQKMQSQASEVFFRSDEWRFFSGSFREFVTAIERGDLKKYSPDLQENAEYHCRFIAKKLTLLKDIDPITVADQLLHLAVAAGQYCPAGKVNALEEVFGNLNQGSENQLEGSLANVLCKAREQFLLEHFGQVAARFSPVTRQVGLDFTNVHVYNAFKENSAISWGTSPGASLGELDRSDIPGFSLLFTTLYIEAAHRFLLRVEYTPSKLIEIIDKSFQNNDLSTVQLFSWMRDVIETKGGSQADMLVDELSSESPRFFGIPVYTRDQRGIDSRILALMLLDFGFIRPKRAIWSSFLKWISDRTPKCAQMLTANFKLAECRA